MEIRAVAEVNPMIIIQIMFNTIQMDNYLMGMDNISYKRESEDHELTKSLRKLKKILKIYFEIMEMHRVDLS